MGRFVFRLPDVGEGVAEAEITAWHVKVGDQIREDQPLCDVLTDKATVEMTSPVSGQVTKLFGEIGAMSAVRAPLAEFEVEGEAESAGETEADRVLEAAQAAPPPEPAPQPQGAKPPKGKGLAAPAVRARAAALGVDLANVHGSGPDGRVTHADLDALGAKASAPKGPHPAVALAAEPGITPVKIMGMRRRIAEKMAASKASIPHFGYVEEVDVTALEALRGRVNDKGPKLTLLPFFARAVILALADFPQINAVYDDVEGVLYQSAEVRLGIAAQTSSGLMVPVVRHAQTLSIRALSDAIAAAAEAAKDGSASRESLSGSTITISSLGPLGGVSAFPVINHPEVAILAPNKIREVLTLEGDRVVTRKVVNLSTAFDHRIVDGHDAASFVAAVKGLLEAPEVMLLG